ncbi:hypothetical protein N7468_000927 [Penicillium chermesinum]|uniref:Uncharacterized protein n=1 Tax=Penicillium chermesinum TaxID=63820 RepID=A0A9W9PFM0_9EURO|nr:uncharacterized protein N7468_000927 [Penicillium chermesinum]KAJ5245944.1 hypothetical protein N7468_000927 [Penicillium chermesinum]KAJ6144240.1 hypothetical protein N7470_008135 [Penicillium chermesinum]
MAVALILGWFGGREFSSSSQDGLLRSEEAWNALMPIGRGFVHHPHLAPFISGIAVFHQLHCLVRILLIDYPSQESIVTVNIIHGTQHAIVVSYYHAVEDAEIAEGKTPPDSYLNRTGTRMAPSHIRHCFDYLRQTIICAADTNMEALDFNTHTTSGWNQPKQCRDYASVFAWAEKWANSTDTGILT